MRRWKLASIATLLLLSVVMHASTSRSQDLPPEKGAEKKPPLAATTMPWSDLLSAENLQGEVTKKRNRLKGTLSSVGAYNVNYKMISVDGTLVAALAGIAIEHSGEFEWKANAPSIRDLGLELAGASTGLGRVKYAHSKAALDALESAFNGTIPTNAPKPEPRRPFHQTVKRANVMKRLEIAKNDLRDSIKSAEVLKAKQESISREAQLIAALGRIIADKGYSGAGEQEYQEFAADLVNGVQDVSVAARDLSFQKFEIAMSKVSKSCDFCHANFVADDSRDPVSNQSKVDVNKSRDPVADRLPMKIGVDKLPELIADRLKMRIDVDFNRTPLQEAFAFFSHEIETKITIDGDALKAGGYTKNMPQTFKGDMTVLDAIKTILNKYQDQRRPVQSMVIVVDEAGKTILVSTQAVCEQQKLTPYELFPLPVPTSTSGVGRLRGRVVIEGTISPLPPLLAEGAATKDPDVCGAQAIPDESILVKDGGLANVFIYLENAPEGGKSAYFQSAVEFDRKNCVFVPHAMVVMTDQTVILLNDDAISHGIHTYPSKNLAFNMVSPPNDRVGTQLKYTVSEKEPLPVVCDLHPWMRAYHLPLDHSFADVTHADGKFEITHLPVGNHEFKVWHEVGKMLEKSLVVNIKPGDNEITIRIPAAKLVK